MNEINKKLDFIRRNDIEPFICLNKDKLGIVYALFETFKKDLEMALNDNLRNKKDDTQ